MEKTPGTSKGLGSSQIQLKQADDLGKNLAEFANLFSQFCRLEKPRKAAGLQIAWSDFL